MFQKFLNSMQHGLVANGVAGRTPGRAAAALRQPIVLNDRLREDIGLPRRTRSPFHAAWHLEQSGLISIAALPPHHR